jgi:16S rRNA (adenine1518-N6/adenine1519-N6)-dimethyltransferase
MHYPRKRFGQNFLVDKHIIQQIISAINPSPAEQLIEIGPGLGALTQEILPIVHKMEVIEIDRDVITDLKLNCLDLGELIIHQGDALKFDFNQLHHQKKLRIIGNLPYNISTPLLFHLLNYKDIIVDMCFMLQKEVVERMCAKPGNKDYGRLSVMLQYHFQIEDLFNVPATAFSPQPKVESAIVYLVPYQQPPYIAYDYHLFTDIVRDAFNQRRKTISNGLKKFITRDNLSSLGLDPSLRAENLSIKDFVRISNSLIS